jgi:hypothetical protein
MSGSIGTHASVTGSGNAKDGGITPATVYGLPLSTSVRPNADGLPPKRRCHSRQLNTTLRAAPGTFSSPAKARPTAGHVRSSGKRLADNSAPDALRLTAARNVHSRRPDQGHLFEHPVLRQPLHEIGVGHSGVVDAKTRVRFVDLHQAPGVAVRQRAQEDRVHHAENCAVQPGPERQCRERYRSEARTPDEQPPCKAQVLHHTSHEITGIIRASRPGYN